MKTEEIQIMVHLFERYETFITNNHQLFGDGNLEEKTSYKSLLRLCNEAILNTEKYPFDKLNRWLGFVQGVLAVHKIIDVDEERDYTRPLFHALYGREVPTF